MSSLHKGHTRFFKIFQICTNFDSFSPQFSILRLRKLSFRSSRQTSPLCTARRSAMSTRFSVTYILSKRCQNAIGNLARISWPKYNFQTNCQFLSLFFSFFCRFLQSIPLPCVEKQTDRYRPSGPWRSVSVSKKPFRPAVRFSEHLEHVLKTCFIEREGGFLPPSHFPRCSIAEV